MSRTLTQERLEEMVVGVQQNPNAIFFEQAVLNVPRSHEHGRRMYDKQVYIKLSQPGVADNMSYQAQADDIEHYRDEYDYFLQNKQGVRSPGIEIIPNLDIAHLQELRDYGILTIPKLADMETVPQHLEYAHRAAKVINSALQESTHVEEESIEEESKPDFVNGYEVFSEKRIPEALLETDRPVNGTDVGQCPVPASIEDSTHRRSARRDDPGGREQRDNPVKFSDNWTMEFK